MVITTTYDKYPGPIPQVYALKHTLEYKSSAKKQVACEWSRDLAHTLLASAVALSSSQLIRKKNS